MDNFEKFENQLLSSYESTLAVEGAEICKEVDSLIQDDHELLIEKANAYCLFCTDPKRVNIDKNLFDRCKKYLRNMSRLNYIKIHMEYLSNSRKEQKKVSRINY